MVPTRQITSETMTFLQVVIDAAGRGLLLLDPDGRIMIANDLARELLDVEPDDRIDSKLPALWALAAPVSEQKQSSSEAPLYLGGRELIFQVYPMLQEGELVGLIGLIVEGTQLESMTRLLPSLNTLTRELDAIIDSSSDGLFVCDGKANVIRMNPASEKIHQVGAEEIVGRNMKQLIEQGFIDRSAALETSRSGKTETLLQDKDGRKLMSIATPVFNDAGELVRIVVSERDITEIDRLQRQIEQKQEMTDEYRHQILEMQQAEHESRRVIARSPEMVRALEQAIKVSKVESSVLLLGESGVGKGLLADLIHQHSNRRKRPLIKINCGAIPESLIEAELFGYEKGAFTGAHDKGKPGHFEMADEGILFLDEIAELPLTSQVKLLRFLEDGRITRLGGTENRKVDVRIVAATHRNLEEMIERGSFRHDLYYRLNVIPIYVPAVRERRECVVPLLRHYIDQFSKNIGTRKRLTREALDALSSYAFPGNVRELMNVCERLVVMTETEVIDLPDLPAQISEQARPDTGDSLRWREGMTLPQVMDGVEKQLLEQALARYRNQMEMAAALGVNQSTIARKLKRYRL